MKEKEKLTYISKEKLQASRKKFEKLMEDDPTFLEMEKALKKELEERNK